MVAALDASAFPQSADFVARIDGSSSSRSCCTTVQPKPTPNRNSDAGQTPNNKPSIMGQVKSNNEHLLPNSQTLPILSHNSFPQSSPTLHMQSRQLKNPSFSASPMTCARWTCLELFRLSKTPTKSLRNQSRHCFNQRRILRRWLKRHVSNISAPRDLVFYSFFGVLLLSSPSLDGGGWIGLGSGYLVRATSTDDG